MMDKNTYKVFQYIIDHPKQDLHLNITSNMCPPDVKLKTRYFNMLQEICLQKKVEHVMQFVSVDAYGKRAEYIRNGLDFNRMMDNVEEFLYRIPYRNSITFICTYNNLSITSMDKLLEKILDLRQKYSKEYQRVWFDVPLLRQPVWQQITLLPESYMSIHEDNIEYMRQNSGEGKGFDKFKDFEIQKMLRNLAYWKKNANASAMLKKNFYAFFNEHDRRRNTNFQNTFPEMIEFWQECKNA